MKNNSLIIFPITNIALIAIFVIGNFINPKLNTAKADILINSSLSITRTGLNNNGSINSIIVGTKAPEISLKNPKDSVIRLSSIKGKLVLIDFWAAWCGPCRKENPTLVAAYKKYKDAKFENGKTTGFTVYSVSLDKDKNAWVNAINKDGLEWPYHVRDLKYWNSEILQKYGVTLIPANFLINKDGIVIATDLRGAELESKLDSLMYK